MSKKIRDIVHTEVELDGGGTILVLNTDATITPEATAMLQALHSRSVGGIREHLEILAEKGSDNFMGTYYVGYGHKSIGDCGSATVFVEGISMLAAKAIQDWRLYSGQESSTRYIDFAHQTFLNPLGTKEGEEIQETWRSFYIQGIKKLKPALEKRFPINSNENKTMYDKAIAARSFDIMRSFLPAGAATNLAWHMNL
ncbi:FAD-dependent thymidylate synthase, partial [Crocinitomicaceae bacterium]|nr:FAD-dependent thymidylate synthase [Crocinitomicaceae bacterium]